MAIKSKPFTMEVDQRAPGTKPEAMFALLGKALIKDLALALPTSEATLPAGGACYDGASAPNRPKGPLPPNLTPRACRPQGQAGLRTTHTYTNAHTHAHLHASKHALDSLEPLNSLQAKACAARAA